MEKVLSLGSYHISDFLDPSVDESGRQKYPLDLFLDTTVGAVRLAVGGIAPGDKMWGQYWYRSGKTVSRTE